MNAVVKATCTMHVYVAAPYVDAPIVREVHEILAIAGFLPTSTWATRAAGAESLTRDVAQQAIVQNDDDLLSSDAMIVIARTGAGGEMFCEVTRALIEEIPVFWVGRQILSTYRDGVILCEDIDDVMRKLEVLRG